MNVYVPSDDCSSFRKFGQKAYTFCINKNIEMKARFDAGNCEKIVVKEHNIGGAKCKAEILEQSETLISTQCSGRRTHSALKSVKRIYGCEDDDDDDDDDEDEDDRFF